MLITVEDENPNDANVLFCVGGATPSWEAVGDLTRVVLMFDGRDEAALGHARSEWRRLKDQGRTISYWRESDEGGWEQAR